MNKCLAIDEIIIQRLVVVISNLIEFLSNLIAFLVANLNNECMNTCNLNDTHGTCLINLTNE